MKKKFLIIGIAIVTILFIFSFLKPTEKISSYNNDLIKTEPAEKIEVIHFHGTNQCFSCIKVGEYALKTIEEKFKEEKEKGIIIFKEINSDLEENKEIVERYKARGSSLFINAMYKNIDNIEEDTNVWRLVNNENSFIKYFEKKLNKLLGK